MVSSARRDPATEPLISASSHAYGAVENGGEIIETNAQGERVHHVVNGIDQGADLERNFSFMDSLGLAFSMLNTWTAMAAALPVGLALGGSATMVWGLLVSLVGQLFISVTLAEICHVYPMAGGQYDWTYMLAPKDRRNGLSFFVGFMAVEGWIALLAAAAALTQALLMGIFSIWNDAYEMQRWQAFLAMMLFLVISLVLNVFGVRALPMLDTIGLYWSVIGMCVVMVTLIYCADGVYQPSKAVFGTFTNDSGWPNSFAFILGMLQSWLTTSSCDAVAHVVEEMPKPYINAPRVMWMQVVTGVATAWPFMVVLLFTLKDFDAVLTSPAGPLGEIYLQVTQSRIGATLLLLISVVAMTFCTQSVGTIVSRMVMSFARDRGFGSYSALLAPVHAKLKSPIMAVMFSSAWVVLFGFIYLASEVALNAIMATCILFNQVSWMVPMVILFYRDEAAFEGQPRSWSLGKLRRPMIAIAMCFLLVTNAAFLFPPSLPVTGDNFNYGVIVFIIGLGLCWAVWVLDAREHFKGPGNVDGRLAEARAA